jgi:N-acetylglucosaminyl-diphospho-decaprenol L-rhamnosyltransferase
LSSSEAEHVDCALIFVTYNSSRCIEQALDSVPAAAAGLRIRRIVVDNNSADNTMAILRTRQDIIAVESGRNLGYAGAINLGRTFAEPCSSILILNPDLVLEGEAIVQLYKALDQPDIGIVVPKLLSTQGHLYPSLRHEPSLTRALGDALLGAHLPKRPGWLGETIHDRSAYEQLQDVAWAGGAALLISAACNEAVGEWDADRFFLYSEETDFAARARRNGYRVRYVPTAKARHEDGGSGRSGPLGALLAVNRVRYFEKYHRRPATSFFRAIVTLHYLLRSADPAQRTALRTLVQRSRWSGLPKAQ